MKPMKTRKTIATLEAAGCREVRDYGRHTVYACPCGEHRAPVPTTHVQVSPGVLRKITQQMPCLPKGIFQ